MSYHRRLPVSELAQYAADPKGYARRKGKLINPRAARYGTRWHEGAGRPRYGPIAALLLILALILYLILK